MDISDYQLGQGMSSAVTNPPGAMERAGVKRMLLIFAALAILGVISLAINVALGLIVLVVAEAFFVMAYRRFSKLRRSSG